MTQQEIDRQLGDEDGLIAATVNWSRRYLKCDQHKLLDRWQIARMAYVKAQETFSVKKGKTFQKYARYCMGRDLFEAMRTELRRGGIVQTINVDSDFLDTFPLPEEKPVGLAGILYGMGGDAEKVLRLIFSRSMQRRIKQQGKKSSRTFVRNRLRERAWDVRRIERAFSEIETCLA